MSADTLTRSDARWLRRIADRPHDETVPWRVEARFETLGLVEVSPTLRLTRAGRAALEADDA